MTWMVMKLYQWYVTNFLVKFCTRNVSYEVWNLYLVVFVCIVHLFRFVLLVERMSRFQFHYQHYTVNRITPYAFQYSFRYFTLYYRQLQNCSSPEKIMLTNSRATVPTIVKTVHLLRRKRCARFELNFSILLLVRWKSQTKKIQDMFFYWGKI